MPLRKVFLFLILTFLTRGLTGQTTDPRCQRSTEGTEFWFGFMQGRNNSGNKYLEITITAREAASFTIYIGKSGIAFASGSVAANGSEMIRIPKQLGEPVGSETIEAKAIRLVSNRPVNVYALNWDANSADVAVIYPVESLGREYFAMCAEPNVHNNVSHGRNSEFMIVATADSTMVTITPSKVTDAGRPAKIPFSVMLNQGELYQVQSANARNLSGQGDLTGSHISSDKPVAVYSGSYSTTIPSLPDMSGYDHLYEQVPPVQAWGREYYAVPLLTRRSDRYRVMASTNGTQVWIGNQAPINLQRGEFYEFLLDSNSPSRIFADKPVMVAQYSQSNRTDNTYTGGNGDPFMIILSPVSQSKNDVTFVTYASNQIRTYYVNVVALTSETGNIELNGAMVGDRFSPFAGTRYSYAQIAIGPGTYRLRNLNPDRGFLAYVYGYGGYESYGYGVGFNLDLVLDLGQSIDFEGDTLALCYGESITLDAGPYFDYFTWSTGDTTQEISVSKEGLYWAIASTIDGCIQHDSIYILVSKPETDLGIDQQGCAPFQASLDAGEGFLRYEWNTGETTRQINAFKTGEYAVAAFDRYGCPARDTMKLTVFPVPEVKISGNELLCGLKEQSLKALITGTDEGIWKNQPFHWKTSQPALLSFENAGITGTDIAVSDWGKFDVRYELVTVDGCAVEADFSMGLFPVPTSVFEFADDPNDKCKGYNREIRYVGNATSGADFHWDFGGSSRTDSIDWDKLRVSVGVFNTDPFISLVVEENRCWSDTTRKAIGANPDFTMNTLASRGCDTATIHFSGQLKVPDALLFEWDFGDGSPVSHLQNPSHFYAGIGDYDVGLQITNELTGCKTGFRIKDMVRIFPVPVAEISLDQEVCQERLTEIFYTHAIDSSFCYWEFDGARMTGGSNDAILVALDKPVSRVRLRVDEFGCFSEWTEKEIRRKPDLGFDISPTEGCQPLLVDVVAKSVDDMVTFQWLTDSLIYPGMEQRFLLADPGEFSITLSAVSGLTGCRDTLTKHEVVRVHPKPVASFDVDFQVALLGQSDLKFTNNSLLSDQFHWDFGDGSTSSGRNLHHQFMATGSYPVVLMAESSFGCRDTAYMTIEILPFDVYTPNAFRPDSHIPENRYFMPITIGVDPKAFHMLVYNRWGALVFESRDPELKWDGRLRNSHEAPMGNYIWKVEYTDIQGYVHTRQGQVMLIR
jgi:PKD repeat protein